MSEGRRLFIGVDIGGTFTDLVLAAEPGGEVRNVKVLTTSEPSQAVLAAVEEVLGGAGAEPSDVRRFVNATTLATNLVLERKGSRTAYLATEGFGDAFRLGKHRPVGSERFDLLYGKPPPLVPPELVVEVRERIDAAGRVLRPLDLEDLARKLDALAEQKPSSVAICLLHAYAHPQHEERVAALVRERLPDVYVAVSSEVWPEYQEYERASTTVVSGYVGPTMAEYVGRLDEGLRQLGIVARLEIMQSSGAVMPAAVAAHKAVYSVESGPAAGAILAADVGARGGWSNVLSFDMGGTTAKAGLIRDGKPAITHGFRVGGTLSAGENTSGEPIRIPVVDLAEVGAGGELPQEKFLQLRPVNRFLPDPVVPDTSGAVLRSGKRTEASSRTSCHS